LSAAEAAAAAVSVRCVGCGRNISRAANVLHASQPAINKWLWQFEEELGIALTEAGEHTLIWAPCNAVFLEHQATGP
jgi:hypothetical protein